MNKMLEFFVKYLEISPVVIRSDNSFYTLLPEDVEEGFTLEELYKAIVTDIVEVHTVAPDIIMIMDEEGMLHNSSVNATASLIYGEYVVGDVVLCYSKYFK